MKSGRHRLPSIVLRTVDYGEADLVVDLFTRDHGRLAGLAKNGRKSRRRFGNLLFPCTLTVMNLTIKAGRDLAHLESGERIQAFDRLALDIRRFAQAHQAVELVGSFWAPLDPSPDVFDLLVWCLERLNAAPRPDETLLIFTLRLLGAAGYAPRLADCGGCGRPIEPSEAWGWTAEAGGVVCRSCAPAALPVHPGTLMILRLIQDMNPAKLDRASIGAVAKTEAQAFLGALVRKSLGHELKTALFLEQLGPGPISARRTHSEQRPIIS
jgi:DNA repair protein RecO (recombination protein O)